MSSPQEVRQIILRKLLDRYERSTAYEQPGPWRRDVIVHVNAQEFPDALAPWGREAMESLSTASRSLAKAGAVRLRHDKAYPDERPLEIRMGPAEVSHAYALAQEDGYVPLSAVLGDVRVAASALNVPDLPPWMCDYLDAISAAEGLAALKVIGLSQERLKREAGDVRAALQAIVGLSRGMTGWERVVSERIFGDSKRLGGIRGLVADLLRRADPAWRDVIPDDPLEILEAYGVRRKPGLLRCAGAVPIALNGTLYALHDFAPTAHLPEAWASAWVDGVVAAAPALITTIENEFPFLSYVLEAHGPTGLGERGELAVFTGGFPSVALRECLVAVAARLPEASFRHWGDADLGGLRIWWFLRTSLNRPLELFRTRAEWLRVEAQSRGQDLSAEERRGLQRLDRELTAFEEILSQDVQAARALLAALLETGRKVEQERY